MTNHTFTTFHDEKEWGGSHVDQTTPRKVCCQDDRTGGERNGRSRCEINWVLLCSLLQWLLDQHLVKQTSSHERLDGKHFLACFRTPTCSPRRAKIQVPSFGPSIPVDQLLQTLSQTAAQFLTLNPAVRVLSEETLQPTMWRSPVKLVTFWCTLWSASVYDNLTCMCSKCSQGATYCKK